MRRAWNPARVIDQGETPRSYLIETGTGSQLQRNRIHPSPNNASNNLANNSSNCVPQGSMTAQYSSANPRESTATGNSANGPSSGNLIIQPSSPNPQCSSVKVEYKIRWLNEDFVFIRFHLINIVLREGDVTYWHQISTYCILHSAYAYISRLAQYANRESTHIHAVFVHKENKLHRHPTTVTGKY